MNAQLRRILEECSFGPPNTHTGYPYRLPIQATHTPIQVTHTGAQTRMGTLPIHPYRPPIHRVMCVWVAYPYGFGYLYGCMGGVPIRFWVPVWVGCMGVWVACMGRLYGEIGPDVRVCQRGAAHSFWIQRRTSSLLLLHASLPGLWAPETRLWERDLLGT